MGSPWRTTTLYCAASRSSSATNEAHAVARNGRATTPRATHILTIHTHTPQTSVALRRAAPPPGGLLWTPALENFARRPVAYFGTLRWLHAAATAHVRAGSV